MINIGFRHLHQYKMRQKSNYAENKYHLWENID